MPNKTNGFADGLSPQVREWATRSTVFLSIRGNRGELLERPTQVGGSRTDPRSTPGSRYGPTSGAEPATRSYICGSNNMPRAQIDGATRARESFSRFETLVAPMPRGACGTDWTIRLLRPQYHESTLVPPAGRCRRGGGPTGRMRIGAGRPRIGEQVEVL